MNTGSHLLNFRGRVRCFVSERALRPLTYHEMRFQTSAFQDLQQSDAEDRTRCAGDANNQFSTQSLHHFAVRSRRVGIAAFILSEVLVLI